MNEDRRSATEVNEAMLREHTAKMKEAEEKRYRDHCAGAAQTAFIGHLHVWSQTPEDPNHPDENFGQWVSRMSFDLAETMVEERKRRDAR